jgi:alkylhydroperoxidase family enzyme
VRWRGRSRAHGAGDRRVSHDELAAGEDPQRLFQVAAWHDAVCFTPKERAALALTDAVTKLGDASAGLRLRFGLSPAWPA